jgi:hypothetical protein
MYLENSYPAYGDNSEISLVVASIPEVRFSAVHEPVLFEEKSQEILRILLLGRLVR